MASSFYDYPILTADSEASPQQDGTNQKPTLRPWKKLQTGPQVVESLDSTKYSNIDIPPSPTGYS